MTLARVPKDLKIAPNPCGATRAESRNWDRVRRWLGTIINAISIGDTIINIVSLFENYAVPFMLTAALEPGESAGGSAAAVILEWNGSAWVAGTAITVHDDLQESKRWRGEVGYIGWARRRNVSSGTTYSIIEMERIAYHVWGTLAENQSSVAAFDGTVTHWSDGREPDETVELWDRNNRFPEARTGAKFHAIYDFDEGRYELITCQQLRFHATAEAAENFDQDTVTVDISNFEPSSYSEFNQDDTAPTTAENTYRLSGVNGDPLHLTKSDASQLWEITTAPHPEPEGPIPVHRFKLTAYLETAAGSSAAAVLRTFDGANYADGAEIVVFDMWGATSHSPGGTRGMFQGRPGMEGFARKREVNSSMGFDEYEVIWMEQDARYLQFHLNEDMGESEANRATAIVDYSWGQGVMPDESPLIVVHDDAQLFKRALAGANGFAVRDEYNGSAETPWYTVIQCDQRCITARATLDGTLCGDDTAVITNFVATSPSPFGQTPDPLPTTVNNPRKHRGKNVFDVWLEWNDDDLAYEIVDIEREETEVVIDVTFDSETGCLMQEKQVTALEVCGPPEDPEEVTCGDPCGDGGS